MKPTVFLLTDTQIKEEPFLEDVDSLLNTGEVPNLFAVDEKAELNEVRHKEVKVSAGGDGG
jgi:dynein heavy chain